jgi:heat shock protein HtpX
VKDYYRIMLRRSIILITLFMGVIFTAGTVLIWKFDLSIWVGIIFPIALAWVQFLVGPTIVTWIYNVEFFEEPYFLKPEILSFIENTCKEMKVPVPKLGVIRDGNPNAFTYGHVPRNARLVVTSGLIDMLTEEELKSVIAHELGHIKHYDFILMMFVSLIPMVLYQIYLKTKDNKANGAFIVGLGAYGIYVLSAFMVLSFSRLREFYADNFAKDVMKGGQQLKSALIKIAYGTASRGKDKKPRVSTMAFTNNIQNDAFMLSSYKASEADKLDKKLMKWDLKNLWGRWYEINSTHPLTSKRIIALTGEKVQEGTPSLKDAAVFLLEVIISVLPWITFFIILVLVDWDSLQNFKILNVIEKIFKVNPLYITLLGLTMLIKYYYSYGRNYKEQSIYELLAREDASPVKGIPAIMEGKIIGKGIPGLFYSEDIVIDDGTGIMIVDYRQPFRFLEFLFGIFKVDSMQGCNVKVVGWYKRGMRPYFVCRHIVLEGRKIISYNYILTQLIGYLFICVGVIAVVI